MPYEWTDRPARGRQLTLWPNRSLPRRGFAWFVAVTGLMLTIPLVAVIGTAALWVLLPFLALTIWAIIHFIGRSYRDGALREVLTLGPDKTTLTQNRPGRPEQRWQANTFWIDLQMHRTSGPVENYLTLRGNGRVVELGAFLSPEERAAIHDDLKSELSRLCGSPGAG